MTIQKEVFWINIYICVLPVLQANFAVCSEIKSVTVILFPILSASCVQKILSQMIIFLWLFFISENINSFKNPYKKLHEVLYIYSHDYIYIYRALFSWQNFFVCSFSIIVCIALSSSSWAYITNSQDSLLEFVPINY